MLINPQKLGFRTFISIMFLLSLGAAVTGFVIIDYTSQHSYQKQLALEKNEQQYLINIETVIDETNNQLSLFKDLLIHGKSPDYYYELLEKYYATERIALTQIEKLSLDSKKRENQHTLVQAISQDYTSMAKAIRKAIRYYNNTETQPSVAINKFLGNRDKALIKDFSELKKLAHDKYEFSISVLRQDTVHKKNIITIISSLIIILIVIYLHHYLGAKVTKPITRMVEVSSQFYKDHNDYTATPDLEVLSKLLQRNVSHMIKILNSTGEAIYSIDNNGTCTFANPACAKLTGYASVDEMLNRNMHDLIHHHYEDGSEYPNEKCNIRKALITGKPSHSQDEVFWHKRGDSFPVEYWSFPIIDNDKISGAVITFNDISQRKNNEAQLNFSHKLSLSMSEALSTFLNNEKDIQPIFDKLLDDLLELTGSEYGFIGEIMLNADGDRYLKTQSITNIAWDDETRALYEQFGKAGLEFTNLNSLFGISIKDDEVVISNDPANDPRSAGLPDGHPALNTYMGIPLMVGKDNIGMVGVANRREGYNQKLLNEITPLLRTFTNILVNYHNRCSRDQINSDLRENETSLSAAQSLAHIGSWRWDIQIGTLNWSDEIYRIFGLQPQQFPATYEAFLNYIHPDDVDAVTSAVTAAVEDENNIYDIHHRIVRPTGEIRFVHERGMVFRNEEKTPMRMLGAVHDVTEEVLSQRDLNQLKSTLDQTADCVFMFNSDDLKFFYVNKGAIEQVGYSHNEMLKMAAYDIKPDFTEEQFRTFIEPMLRGEKDFVFFETQHQHKDGHNITVEIGLQYIQESSEVGRFVAVVRDITERKRIELELAKHRENLEELVTERTTELHDAQDELVRKERLATLGQLTATVSHELRNPLGAMRPSLYIIEKKTASLEDEKLVSAIERVNRNISRCDRIIDELLDFTRITGLDQTKSKLDTWLGEMISEQHFHDGITVDWQPGLGDYIADIDFNRFRRVMINVIENGCHAMLDVDDINKVIPDARLTVHSFLDEERVSIQITDTGSGIPDDVLPKIFTPLYSTKGFGVGLGMPTVKQIMEQHSGGIDIETHQGKGTTVTLSLPLSSDDEVII